MAEGGSSTSGESGPSSHEDADGWMSGEDKIGGWEHLIFSDISWL